MKPIKWKTVDLDPKQLKPTPNNYKLKTEEGLAQFDHSVKKYGRAGAVICNKDLTLINGNTNWERALKDKEKRISVSIPDRQLTPKEFREFAAMFDAIRAGEVDILRIKQELGTTASFFKEWGMEMPGTALNKLAELEKADGKIVANVAKGKEMKKSAIELRPVTLLFTSEQATKFLARAESIYTLHKTDNVTDLCFKLMFKK